MTPETLWIDILTNEDLPKPIANRDEVGDIVGLMARWRIDPQLFGENLICIVTGGRGTGDFLSPPPEMSESVRQLSNPMTRPMAAPMWMLAGFPDVTLWISEAHEKATDESEGSQDAFLRLYGIEPKEAESFSERDLLNSDDQIKARFYAAAIEKYVDSVGKQPEVSIEPGRLNDIYLASALVNSLGAEDMFGLIARNTAGCYRHLKSAYNDRIVSEESLLAAAGTIDAAAYIHLGQVTVRRIKELAAAAAKATAPLSDFVLGLEVILMTVDNLNYQTEDVKNAVQSQAENIGKVLDDTMTGTLPLDPSLVHAVDQFMSQRGNRRLWKELGIHK